MDIAGLTITGGTLLVQFLRACSAFSADAESLKLDFEWQLKLLERAQAAFAENQKYSLALDDDDLMQRTSDYLDNLVSRVHKTFDKMKRRGFFSNAVNMATWMSRRSQIFEMQRELHIWIERLDLRLLNMPEQMKTTVVNVYEGHVQNNLIQPSAVVRNNNRLQEFLALTIDAKQRRSKGMLLDKPGELISKIRTMETISSLPVQHDTQQIIFSSREVPPHISPGTPEFEAILSDMGELAAALGCLDSAMDVQLLQVKYYFYHDDLKQFLFAQVPPCRVDSMMTLEELITHDPFPGTEISLSQRLKLAYKIAEAVFFLHTAGFCHKNITSRSVVILRRYDMKEGDIPNTIDEAYLMGFDLIRGTNARTYKEGTSGRDGSRESPRGLWEFGVFQHPDRLQGDSSPRYSKTYDVYSLGVVLLTIGFWQPLAKVAGAIDKGNSSGWAQELSQITQSLGPRVGERYQRMVQWCLHLSGDQAVKNAEFIREVLDPLEEMMGTLA